MNRSWGNNRSLGLVLGPCSKRPVVIGLLLGLGMFVNLVQPQGFGQEHTLRAFSNNQNTPQARSGIEGQRKAQFDAIKAAMQDSGDVRVIVEFKVPNIRQLAAAARNARGARLPVADADLAGAIAPVRQTQLARLAGTTHKVIHTFSTIPFVALNVGADALAALEASPDVLGITIDSLSAPTLDNTVNITGASAAWGLGFDGSGFDVAVLDTGVRSDHVFFAGKTVTQACFASGATGAGDCPNGTPVDTTSPNAAEPYPSNFAAWDHGTHVAGIAVGNAPGEPLFGIARGGDLISVKVFSRFPFSSSCNPPGSSCLLSFTSDGIAALEYLFVNRASFNLASVNMSLGVGFFADEATCDSANAAQKFAIDNLRGIGVATVVAAGNDGFCPGMASPACISTAVAVGSVTDSGFEVSASNYDPVMLDLYAPGVAVRSSVPNTPTSFASFTGTSMASPHVAGAWAILKQVDPAASVSEILTKLQTTGDTIGGFCVGTPAQKRIQIDAALGTGTRAKVFQEPSDDGESVPSNIDWDDNDPNRHVADDFVSDGRPITGVRWWGSEVTPVPPSILDDGLAGTSIGVNDGTTGGAFGWANQFNNSTGAAITLTTIEVAFGSPLGGGSVSVGDAVDGVIWVDAGATGNMANATPLIRWSLPGGVHANDGVTYASHTIPGGAIIPAGADYYVGCGDLQSQIDGVMRFPAPLDDTVSQGRSWGFFPSGAITDPFDENLAGQMLDTIDNFGLPGNWLVRAFGDPAPVPDGWYITFHEPLSSGGSAEVPLGLYYCDEPIVSRLAAPFGSCDGWPITEYTVDLADCCLIHANPDSRDTLTPATPTAFNEVECFDYAVGIQATIGHRWEDPGGGCVEMATGNAADGDFWGWESTSHEIGAFYGLQSAFETVVSMSGSDWLYGPWSNLTPNCSVPNMAFALFTTTDPGTNNDLNHTGIPDLCECVPPLPVIDEPSPVAKNRFLSIDPQAVGIDTAIRVTITGSTTFPGSVGQSYWVGAPNSSCTDCNGTPFIDASLQCTQHCQDWGGLGVIHVHGPEVVPETTYEIEVTDCLCDSNDPLSYSSPLTLTTQKWGDVVTPFGGIAQPAFGDITALVDTFKCTGSELPTVRAKLQANTPDPCINPNFADITACVDGYKQLPYLFAGPVSCPP